MRICKNKSYSTPFPHKYIFEKPKVWSLCKGGQSVFPQSKLVGHGGIEVVCGMCGEWRTNIPWQVETGWHWHFNFPIYQAYIVEKCGKKYCHQCEQGKSSVCGPLSGESTAASSTICWPWHQPAVGGLTASTGRYRHQRSKDHFKTWNSDRSARTGNPKLLGDWIFNAPSS